MSAQISEKAQQMMDKVLQVRYSNLELERSLCSRLLALCKHDENQYISAFAHTYLGDYYIARGHMRKCIVHLSEARSIADAGGFKELFPRIYCLLGLYYDIVSDEQSSLQFYTDGITIARQMEDSVSESLILNNIACNFQRHCGYSEALRFYTAAYTLLSKSNAENTLSHCIILNNLATVSLYLGQLPNAENYLSRCEELGKDITLIQVLVARCKCKYYSLLGNTPAAESWGEYIISEQKLITANKLCAFDIYDIAFESVLALKNAALSARFLKLLEASVINHKSADLLRRLEEHRIAYSLTFETNDALLANAYKRYYLRAEQLAKLSDQAIANGLKTSIQLFALSKKGEQLNAEQNHLKAQVNLDELTRVYTRRYLEELMQTYESDHSTAAAGFIMIDVDCLKEYNDTHGHPAGDEVLRAVGECLNTHATERLFPCRFGGDEFVCFCHDQTDDELVHYITAVREDLQRRNIPHHTSNCACTVTLSIGFSNCAAPREKSLRTLFDEADKALYTSKINGRNTYCKHL